MKIKKILSVLALSLVGSSAFASTAAVCGYSEKAPVKIWNESKAGTSVVYNGVTVGSNKVVVNTFQKRYSTYADYYYKGNFVKTVNGVKRHQVCYVQKKITPVVEPTGCKFDLSGPSTPNYFYWAVNSGVSGAMWNGKFVLFGGAASQSSVTVNGVKYTRGAATTNGGGVQYYQICKQ